MTSKELENLSIKELENLQFEIIDLINAKKRKAYSTCVEKVIKAVEEVKKTEPYMPAIHIDFLDYDSDFEKELDWNELYEALTKEHY